MKTAFHLQIVCASFHVAKIAMASVGLSDIIGISTAFQSRCLYERSSSVFCTKLEQAAYCIFHKKFLYLVEAEGTWRCFLLMNFEVSCQISFSRKWFSAFRAAHRCPINLFVVMCLDMSVKVLLVWCFVSARWTCEDFFGCFLFLVVLSHVISLRVFPNEVFLTHQARKGTFVMCS